MESQVKINGISLLEDEFSATVEIDHETARISEPVDVVSIDGETRFVFRRACTYGVKPTKNVEVYEPVKPTVHFTELGSGLYAPVSYMDSGTIQELKRLDEEYLARWFMYKIDCEEPTNPRCGDLYTELYEIERRQAELIVDNLEKRGFEFTIHDKPNEYTVATMIEGPDGEIGQFETPDIPRIKIFATITEDCYVGKWSLLGPALYTYVKHGSPRLPGKYVKSRKAWLPKSAYIFLGFAELVKDRGIFRISKTPIYRLSLHLHSDHFMVIYGQV